MTASVSAGLAQDIAAAVERLRQITVQVRTRGAATGAGISWNGLVITNAHVLRGEQASIELSDGRSARARVVARDVKRDLAALEVEGGHDVVAPVVRDSPLRVGELVIAIGNPGGQVGAATLGVIHRADGEGEGRTRRWILADVRLAPGFSGGPLADSSGRLVGVTTMMQGGLALAIPANAVEAWLQRSLATAAS